MIKEGDSVKSVNKKKISYANVAMGKSYKNIAKTAGIKLEFVENGKNPFLLEYPYSKYRNKITNVLVYNPIYDGLKIQWEKIPTPRKNIINIIEHKIPNKTKFLYLFENWDAATEIIKGGKNKVINELSNVETYDIKQLLKELDSGKSYEERAIILHNWLIEHKINVVDSKYITRAGAQGTFLTPLYQLWYKLYTKLSRPKKSVKKASVKKLSVNNSVKSVNNSVNNSVKSVKSVKPKKKKRKIFKHPETGKEYTGWNSSNNNSN